MSNQYPAQQYPENVFQPLTQDEIQELAETLQFHHIFKSPFANSHIYERKTPDGNTSCLKIDGPTAGSLTITDQGVLKLNTGVHDPEIGPKSGQLHVSTYGQQQIHRERSDIQYNDGLDPEGQALNIIAFGDVVEEARGSERTIKAQKITLIADEEISIIGNTGVTIMAGQDGSGTFTVNAGSIETNAASFEELILGQKMSIVSEDSKVQFDPRASVNIISPGHVNHKILGDYKVWVGGVQQNIVAGGPAAPPLVQDRTSAYTVKTVVGGQDYDAAGFINRKAGGAITDTAGAAFSATAGGDATVAAGGTASLDAGGEAGINAGGGVNISAIGTVSIQGALILLN